MVRMVIGTCVCPPDMKRSLAAWLTIMSIATVVKFISMISATGRMPTIAAPIAAPMIACSEIGVERTRVVAVLGRQALGDADDAALLAVGDVLAEHDHVRVQPPSPRPARG